MSSVHVLRVFVDAGGKFGDLASVVIDERRHIDDKQRQEMALRLNTGETAFVNSTNNVNVSIMHPQGEISFAGVAMLATVWLMIRLQARPLQYIEGRDGKIKVWQAEDLTWARAKLKTMPPWHYEQLGSAAAVESLTLEETGSWEHTMVWAWEDEAKGLIRARTFASDWGLPEAQGNGSGSMVLANLLKRGIEIMHGKGSMIYAKPAPNNCADIGGRIVEEYAPR